MSSFSIFL